jgi:YrbI family 3-deoxy-D-manno-octulosonate 8-phosphate phosphatase
MRAAEMGVDIVRQGFEDKLPAARAAIDELKLTPAQVCYIGDDLPDLPVLGYIGAKVAVADAVPEVRAAVDYVTKLPGGAGAVRELIELILKSKKRWDELVRRYTNP